MTEVNFENSIVSSIKRLSGFIEICLTSLNSEKDKNKIKDFLLRNFYQEFENINNYLDKLAILKTGDQIVEELNEIEDKVQYFLNELTKILAIGVDRDKLENLNNQIKRYVQTFYK